MSNARVLIRAIHPVDSGTGHTWDAAGRSCGVSVKMPRRWVELVGLDLQLGCQSGVIVAAGIEWELLT